MPFYEYECKSCGHYVEAMQKISDPPLTKCPECGEETLTKLISAPVFRLKGSGWYETDFKGDQDRKRNLAVEKDETSASGKSGAAESKDGGTSGDKPAVKPAESGKSSEGSKTTASSGASGGSGAGTAAATSSSSSSESAAAKPASKPAAKKDSP